MQKNNNREMLSHFIYIVFILVSAIVTGEFSEKESISSLIKEREQEIMPLIVKDKGMFKESYTIEVPKNAGEVYVEELIKEEIKRTEKGKFLAELISGVTIGIILGKAILLFITK